MSKVRGTIHVLTFFVFTLSLGALAQAQATRTWVSGVGDDVNPCSRTAPCKTFAGAISKTAVNGEIDALDPGGFGTLTVTKSITVDGEGTMASVLAAGTNGFNINDSATATPGTIVVVLRNLSIQGAGTGLDGIRFTSGRAVHVEDCRILGFTSDGIDMSVTNSNAQLVVRDTIISGCVGNAILMNPSNIANVSATADLNNTRLDRCGNGLTMQTGVTRATVTHSAIVLMAGPGNGVNLVSGTPIIHIDHSTISHNTTGITANVGSANIGETYITNNATSLTPVVNVHSWGDNMIFDNGTNNLPVKDRTKG